MFNLKNDPNELIDESNNARYKYIINKLRNFLIEELKDREEKFVIDGKLQKKDNIEPILSFLNNDYKEI